MHKAFTLIELMVSIAIIGIMTTIGFYSFGSYTESKQLRADTQALSAKLGEAKARAFSGQRIDNIMPKCYGIYANQPGFYYLYGDLTGDSRFGDGDLIIETIKLGSKVTLANLNPNAGACFKPNLPSSQVCNTLNVCGGNEAIFFTLRSKSGTEKTIMINALTGVIAIDAIDCPGPYMRLNTEGVCDWNCGENTVPNKATMSCVCVAGMSARSEPDSQGRLVCGIVDEGFIPDGY